MEWRKKKECPAAETLNAEIQGTKDLFTQQIKTLTSSIETGFKSLEAGQTQSNKGFDNYVKKMDGLILGNGEEGLKTKVALQENRQKTLKSDIDSVGRKTTNIETTLHQRIDDVKKDLKDVSDATLINTTKMYVYGGLIGLIIALAAIFAPMAFGQEITPKQFGHSDSRIDRIAGYMYWATHSEDAKKYSLLFGFINKEPQKPILCLMTVDKCLDCRQCKRCIGELRCVAKKFSKAWHKEFRTYRTDIYNSRHKMLYVIDSKGVFKAVETDRGSA